MTLIIMEKIIEYLSAAEYEDIDIQGIFEEVARNGDTILLQHDGRKTEEQYSASIIVVEKADPMLLCNANTIHDALRVVLTKYLELRSSEGIV